MYFLERADCETDFYALAIHQFSNLINDFSGTIFFCESKFGSVPDKK